MDIKIAHRAMMCSILILGHLPSHGTFQQFLQKLKDAIKEVEENKESTRDVYYDQWSASNKSVQAALDGHEVSEYAFMICSTYCAGEDDFGDYDEGQSEIEPYLKALGFKSSRKTHNEKNETTIKFWIVPIKTLLKKMDEVDASQHS